MKVRKIRRALVPIKREPTEDEKWQLYKSEERLWQCQTEMLDILEHLGEWSIDYQRDYYVLKDYFDRDTPPWQRKPYKQFKGRGD